MKWWHIWSSIIFRRGIFLPEIFCGIPVLRDLRRTLTIEWYTDYCMNNSFWVGVYPGMTQAMLDEIVKRIHEAVQG